MRILGISAYYHDSAAALIEDGRILAAVQEERFTRVKHDDAFPEHAIRSVLDQARLGLDDLDAVVFYDKPFLKFERLLQTYLDTAPRSWWAFVNALPVWVRQKIFLKQELRKALRALGPYDAERTPLLFSQHHLSHAASAFYASPFDAAAVLTVDGVGEWATASIAHGTDTDLTLVREMHFPHSLGMLYSAFTYFLGFRVNSGEYKMMGLAPYASADDPAVQAHVQRITTELVQVFDDGSLRIDMRFFAFHHGLRMIDERRFERLFGMARRQPEAEITAEHTALAKAIQLVTEDVVLKMARHAVDVTGERRLCLAGGVALNCVANGRLLESGIVDELFIQPAAGDAGGALGAAWLAHHAHFGEERVLRTPDAMQGGRLGPSFDDLAIQRALERVEGIQVHRLDEAGLIERTADLLADGTTIGWFQGRMEFGPRALGGRSILASPLDRAMQVRLNLQVKKRESFRPFAPIMLREEFKRFFGHDHASPYMLLVHHILPEHRTDVEPAMDLAERIRQPRSVLPAITHVDHSARIQTVEPETDPRMHALLSAFKARTGVGVLVNTSFNVRGEPIVQSPEDAIACYLATDLDHLIIGPFLVSKTTN